MSVRQTVTTSVLPPTTVLSAFSSGTTEDTKMASTPKKPKMPRVTLKLRENETIPQMYMKAGIASYKKGNITTSVLAPRLSLEGLIFKTPEGTIKPWPQKWFFSDPSADFQWKVSAPLFLDQMLNTSLEINCVQGDFRNIYPAFFNKVHRLLCKSSVQKFADLFFRAS